MEQNKRVNRGDRIEAMQWLTQDKTNHYVGEMEPAASRQLVEDLYRMGAKEVIAVDIRRNAGLASTDSLIVTMPTDPKKRSRIFAWDNERVKEIGMDPREDRGEEHLLIWFD